MSKTKTPLYLKEAQLFLDDCKQKKEAVYITALTKDGELRHYDGWLVQSSHWQAGTHDLRNPKSGQLRKVRDILIFEINNHPVYI